MDDLQVQSRLDVEHGTTINCTAWLRKTNKTSRKSKLDIGVASRPYPGQRLNGDSFIIKRWDNFILVGVIDGLGHGQYAYRASQKARDFIERHYDQSLTNIFNGVSRTCHATRGVVMALTRFDFDQDRFTVASVGNIEIRIFNNEIPFRYIIRRGILGTNSPKPVETVHEWELGNIMLLFSDGIKSTWRWADYRHIEDKSAAQIAQGLMDALCKDTDDATIIAVKGNWL
jgi:serine/threonine protein phosphatase PrpC